MSLNIREIQSIEPTGLQGEIMSEIKPPKFYVGQRVVNVYTGLMGTVVGTLGRTIDVRYDRRPLDVYAFAKTSFQPCNDGES